MDTDGEPVLIRNIRGRGYRFDFAADERRPSLIRSGGAIALLLAAQSLRVAALFWTLAAGTDRARLCPLVGDATLLTRFDLDNSEVIADLAERSLLLALIPGLIIVVGVGLLAAGRATRQVDAVPRLAERIVRDDLRGRLPVAQRPDSFEMLCAHINATLDQIEWSMRGGHKLAISATGLQL